MTRTQVINTIAESIQAKSYLEVGTRNPADNLLQVNVAYRVGVEPRWKEEGRAPEPVSGVVCAPFTSDEYFSACERKFDVIFIDANHTAEASQRDLLNALAHLARGGFVILHDCLPRNEREAAPVKPSGGSAWSGEVWRTWAYARSRKDLVTHCVDCDHGCGIIRRGRAQRNHPNEEKCTWREAGWQAIVTPAEFKATL